MSEHDITLGAGHGMQVGQWIYFGRRLPWYRRSLRWLARVVLRRKPVPVGYARIVAIEPHRIVLDRPIVSETGEVYVSKFTKNGEDDV